MKRLMSVAAMAAFCMGGAAYADCVQGFANQENGKATIQVWACDDSDSQVRFDNNPAVIASEELSRNAFRSGEKAVELSYGDETVMTELKMFIDRGANKMLRVSIPDVDQALGLGEAMRAGETVTAELITASTGARETLYSGVLTVN